MIGSLREAMVALTARPLVFGDPRQVAALGYVRRVRAAVEGELSLKYLSVEELRGVREWLERELKRSGKG